MALVLSMLGGDGEKITQSMSPEYNYNAALNRIIDLNYLNPEKMFNNEETAHFSVVAKKMGDVSVLVQNMVKKTENLTPSEGVSPSGKSETNRTVPDQLKNDSEDSKWGEYAIIVGLVLIVLVGLPSAFVWQNSNIFSNMKTFKKEAK
ncbi:hypothetical protein CSB37_02565 [bacterium DOLZORAL124_38_8]|nr:MAG: hypothetical protein CSB37_02565 [bacterium DOLZORAL124_38_8]